MGLHSVHTTIVTFYVRKNAQFRFQCSTLVAFWTSEDTFIDTDADRLFHRTQLIHCKPAQLFRRRKIKEEKTQ